MSDGFDSNPERQLDELFASYRAACPQSEGSADFLPRLWARIDERQRGQAIYAWRRCTQAFLGMAAMACLFLIVLQIVPRQSPLEVQTSYLDQLSEDERRADTFLLPVALNPGSGQSAAPSGPGAGER
jgi:hypothetical protein